MSKPYAKSFYNSAAWEACRTAYVNKRMQIDGATCERCGTQQGREVHHVIPININNIHDPAVTLNHDNLRLLCKDCHFAVHREMILAAWHKQADERILSHGCYVDTDGQLRPRRVVLVWGAPGAGKNKYVEDHRDPDDIIIDLDAIQEALGRKTRESRSNRLDLALSIRRYILSMIMDGDRSIDAKTVWVIGGYPSKAKRMVMLHELRAEEHYCEATLEECKAHIMQDDSRHDKQLALAICEDYFERLQR